MKILIDDERKSLPDGTRPDIIIRNYRAALLVGWGVFEGNDVYLDHDLGSVRTGYDWITKLEEFHHNYKDAIGFTTGEHLPAKIVCVSMNGPGRLRIQQVIDNLYNRD